MDFTDARTQFLDFDLDATINSSLLEGFQYVSKGGFALVFVANYRRSDGVVQPVAVKVLKPENHFRPENYSKFLQEVAFQTALPHPFIVRALGFCSVPVSQLLAAVPPAVLLPNVALPSAAAGGGGGGRRAAAAGGSATSAAQDWFTQQRLHKCWALVMELMPDGNLFDQVLSAARNGGGAAAAAGGAGGGGGSLGPGAYSDAQALLWLIDVADAMTYLHSREPLTIHRDLKLENVLLRRESDGLLRAKLSDFGLAAAVDAAGRKMPTPSILRAPGQSLQDVCAALAPAALGTATSAPPPRPLDGHHGAPAGLHQQQQQQQQQWQQPLPRRAQSSSQVLVQATTVPVLVPPGPGPKLTRGSGQDPAAAAAGKHRPGPMAISAGIPAQGGGEGGGEDAMEGQRQGMGMGAVVESTPAAGQRPWSAAQVHVEVPPPPLTGVGMVAAAWGGQQQQQHQGVKERQAANTGTAGQGKRQQQQRAGKVEGGGGGKRRDEDFSAAALQAQRSAISWTGGAHRGGMGGSGTGFGLGDGVVGCGGAASPGVVGPHGLQPTASVPVGCPGRSQGRAGGAGRAPSLASCRASSSRLSETGHAQVKIDQLNGLLRLGMGHRDYLPDMYQMTFKLTTQCGSVCYMSPEVARQLPYNQKADVYSFGCIMFEVMGRQLLSDGIPEGDVDAAVEYLSRVAWAGWRPTLPAGLPKELRLLISLCWHREPRLRPSFPTIATRLREVLLAASVPARASRSSLALPPPPPPSPHEQLLSLQKSLQHHQQQNALQQQQQQHRSQEKRQQQNQQESLYQHVRQLQGQSYWPEATSPYMPMTPPPQPAPSTANGNGNVNAWTGFQLSSLLAGGGGGGGVIMPTAAGGTGQAVGHAASAAGAALAAAAAAAATQSHHQQQQHQQQQQHNLVAHRQQQQQLQLQLQLQQLNACTARLGAAAATGGTGGASGMSSPPHTTGGHNTANPPSPCTLYSVASRLPSTVESTCTTAIYTTAIGYRMSSPVLGTLGGIGIGGGAAAAAASGVAAQTLPGRGALSLETGTTAQPGRATATAFVAPYTPHSDGCQPVRSSLPSPVSPSGSRGGTRRSSGTPSPGQEARISRSTLPKSEGSGVTASAASSFRSPRGQQQMQQGLEMGPADGKEGCTSLCALM